MQAGQCHNAGVEYDAEEQTKSRSRRESSSVQNTTEGQGRHAAEVWLCQGLQGACCIPRLLVYPSLEAATAYVYGVMARLSGVTIIGMTFIGMTFSVSSNAPNIHSCSLSR